MALKALIFDLDGTVIQSHNILYMALQDYFTPEQCERVMHEYAILKGLNEKQAVPRIRELLEISHISVDQLRHDLVALCNAYKKKIGMSFVQGFENFHASYAATPLAYCIATNGMGASLATTMGLINIKHYFGERIYTPEHVDGKTKPDPALFLYALGQLGCSPEEAIIFEDSHIGVAAAHAAGVACIGINTAGNLDFDRDNLLLCVDDYSTLTVELIHKKFSERE